MVSLEPRPLTAQAILYDLAGRPPQEGASASGVCRICCAPTERGTPYRKWQGANFTDQNKLRAWHGEVVCEACAWAHAWNPPPGHAPAAEGKKGANLRLYSHLWDEIAGYLYLSKGDKPAIRAWLRAPREGPWFGAISDTGKKHVVPWTPVNPRPSGRLIRFEEATLSLPESWILVDEMTTLLSRGVTKDEITNSEYSQMSWRHSAAALRIFEAAHGRLRGSSWWRLALWLSQRDEAEYERNRNARGTEGPGARGNNRGDLGAASRVPGRRREPAQALGSDSGQGARRRAPSGRPADMGDGGGAVTESTGAEQLPLLGDSGS